MAEIVKNKKRNEDSLSQYPSLITMEDQNKILFLNEKIKLHTKKLNEMKKK